MLRSVVAVLDKSGTPIGAGCILKGTGLSQNTCYVATCAHVVFNAINSYDSHPQSINSPTIVSRTINVGWPNERPVLATIVEWWPPQPNTFSSADSLSDLCLLQIEQEYLPRAARLATDTEIIPPNTTVWAYGYSTPKGEWADASTAIAKDAMGWLQLNPLGIRSVTVRQGFSGTPVWDEQKKFVYGLVAEGTTNGKVEYSRAIPVEILLRAFPNIREIDCNLDNCVGLLDDGIPSLPDYYVDRPMPFEEVRQKLLRPKYAGAKAILGITSADSGDVHPLRGIGKTLLAALVVRDKEIRRRYADGIIWITVGDRPNFAKIRSKILAQRLGGASAIVQSAVGRNRLTDALKHAKCLIVLDDMRKREDIREFPLDSQSSKYLVTLPI